LTPNGKQSDAAPPELETREATVRDAEVLNRLNHDFNNATESPERLAQRMENPQCVETPILAEVNSVVVGFAALRVVPCVFYDDPHAELTELYVDPAFRRRGVGRALIAHAEQLALARGAKTLLVLTDFYNDDAQMLYRRTGFVNHDLAMEKALVGVDSAVKA
jgi:ribosomal protein S18 acetylase RimI-like enzyme